MVNRDARRTRRVVVRHALPATGQGVETQPVPDGPATTPVAAPDSSTRPIPVSRAAPEPRPAPDSPPKPESPPKPDSPTASGSPTASETTAAPRAPEPAAAAIDPGAPALDPDATAPAPVVPATVARSARSPENPYGFQTFPTEALLADHAADADELRADVDRLRRQMDASPPPMTTTRRRNHKPLLGVLVVGGTLAAIATATLVPWSDLGSDPAATSTQVGTGAAARPGAVPALAQPPRKPPAGSLGTSGPGIDAPGTMMVVQVAESGALNVTEQAVLGPRGLRSIDLRVPSMASLGGQVAQLTPTIHDLRVSVNGTPVTAIPTADGPGWVVVAAGQERARTVELSYQMQDGIVRTKPSSSGRALGVSLPLLGQALRDQGLPLVVRAQGAGVTGATCPSAPVAQMLCGEQDENGWLATIPEKAASPTLLLQLNLAQ